MKRSQQGKYLYFIDHENFILPVPSSFFFVSITATISHCSREALPSPSISCIYYQKLFPVIAHMLRVSCALFLRIAAEAESLDRYFLLLEKEETDRRIREDELAVATEQQNEALRAAERREDLRKEEREEEARVERVAHQEMLRLASEVSLRS